MPPSDEEFIERSRNYGDSRIELSADGEIEVLPWHDLDSSSLSGEVTFQLMEWNDKQGKGLVTTAKCSYHLPNGARRSPDHAWSSKDRWDRAKQVGVSFPVFVPDLAVEVLAPTEVKSRVQWKLGELIDNGVQLAWLIDLERKNVEIYRPGRLVEVLESPSEVRGEGPVEGFVLDLKPILT